MEYTEACFGIYQHRNFCIEIAKQLSYSERIAIYTWCPICYCRVFNQTVFGISEASLLWNAFSISRLSLVCMAPAPHKGPRRNMSKLLNMKDRSIPVIMACVPDNMEKHDDIMTWMAFRIRNHNLPLYSEQGEHAKLWIFMCCSPRFD